MRILLSNDDGVFAPGLHSLYRAVKNLGDVWVVAPMEEKSTTGHSLTLHKPIRVNAISKRVFGVSGSPADCINIGIREIIKKKPDLVISGINRGANLGQDIYYSGTVSAAREACIMGIPSFAVSLVIEFAQGNAPESTFHFNSAGKVLRKIFKDLSGISLPLHTMMNLNVPNLPMNKIKGVRLAKQGFRHYTGSILKRRDHRGRDYFWVGGSYKGFKKEKGTDCHVSDEGYASITPLKLDVTDYDYIRELDGVWPLWGE